LYLCYKIIFPSSKKRTAKIEVGDSIRLRCKVHNSSLVEVGNIYTTLLNFMFVIHTESFGSCSIVEIELKKSCILYK